MAGLAGNGHILRQSKNGQNKMAGLAGKLATLKTSTWRKKCP